MDGFRWTVRVTNLGHPFADVFVRKLRYQIGAPVQFDEEDSRVSAVESLLGAVGADLVNGLRAAASRRGLPIDAVEAVVTGELDNPLVHLGVIGESGTPALARLAAKVYASSSAGEEALREVWQNTLDRSPLIATLRPTVRLDLELQIVP